MTENVATVREEEDEVEDADEELGGTKRRDRLEGKPSGRSKKRRAIHVKSA